MNKLFLFFSVLLPSALLAQQAVGTHYNLSVYSGAYSSIEEATSLDQGNVWDDPNWTIPFPFPFFTFNDTINTLYVGEYGTTVYAVQEDLLLDIFLVYYADIANADNDTLVSPVSYTTIGPPGDQILIVEWQNVGFYEDGISNGSFTNTTNFQLWFYQNGGVFEYHYGPNAVNAFEQMHPEGGVIVGFIENLNSANGQEWYGFYTIGETPENPVVNSLSPLDLFNNNGFPPNTLLNAEPSNGLIYRFEPTFQQVNEIETSQISAYPNPCREELIIHFSGQENTTAEIYNSTGQFVETILIQPGVQKIITSQLSPGMYHINSKGIHFNFIKN
jgi:Secretion system C-terminal sorting domain